MGAALDRIGGSTRVSEFKASFTSDGDYEPAFDEKTECVLVCRDRSAYAVHSPDDPSGRLDVVTKAVETVHNAENRDRVSYTNMADLAKHYAGFSALFCYKAFGKGDLLALALAGRRFPSGVTRFSVPKRALYFDLPLGILEGGGSTEGKQAELAELIQRRIKNKKIRFYVEPTFIFDD
jgi:hypothetical protein